MEQIQMENFMDFQRKINTMFHQNYSYQLIIRIFQQNYVLTYKQW